MRRDCARRGASEINIGQFSHGQSNPAFTVAGRRRLWCGSNRPASSSRARTTSGASSNLRAILGRRACRRRALRFAMTRTFSDPLLVLRLCEGRRFRDPYLERASIDERPLLYKSAARAAATLHAAAPPSKLVEALGGSPQIGLPRAAGQDLDAAISRCGREAGRDVTDVRVADHAARLRSACEEHATDVAGDVDLLSVAHGDFQLRQPDI